MGDVGGDDADTGDEGFLDPEELTWHDYVALAWAMAQTVLLPFLLATATLLALYLLSIYLL